MLLTFVYQAGADFKLVRQNELPDDELYLATPAICDDKLLIRSSRRLYCVAVPTDQPEL